VWLKTYLLKTDYLNTINNIMNYLSLFYVSAILTAASAAIPAGLTYKYGWGASPLTPGTSRKKLHAMELCRTLV
jgi:hypothetical protein